MKTITISQEKFGRIFKSHEYEYRHARLFMKGHELLTEFKETKRFEMLQSFRETLKKLKDNIETGE